MTDPTMDGILANFTRGMRDGVALARGAASPAPACPAWVPVERELPPLNVPVWLYLPDIRQPVIGCRSDGGEGWLWCRCYDDFWFDVEWKTSTAEADGDEASHWMPLPLPPNAEAESSARSEV